MGTIHYESGFDSFEVSRRVTGSFIKIHRRYYEEKRKKKEIRKALREALKKKIWNDDPLALTEKDLDDKKKKNSNLSLIQKIRSNKHIIFFNHIFKYTIRYGLKYFIFVLTWLLETGTDNQLYNIPIYILYVISFMLVFIKETNIVIFRICFWLYNASLISIFVFIFVRQLDDSQIKHDFDLNSMTALLLIYTFSYLYKHLNKIDRSLVNLLFKNYQKSKLNIEKIEDQGQINLKDILEVEDIQQHELEKQDSVKSGDSKKKKQIKVNAYQKSNWIVFVIFLCPVLMIELAVYYCLMINAITDENKIWDSIYFVSLVVLVIILNSVRAEDLNQIFKRSVLFLFILFVIELYYLVNSSLKVYNSSTKQYYFDYDNMYTRFYKQKAKLVLIVLSLKTCLSFFGIEM